ncbi:UDP-N-acetylmuramate dehydrogenase [Candidatus Gracilibacteria bacterium]|nr:UDP-N-acetylmuramate dehydrogenase [Candidatus Gracilibacteria bacterium]
MLKSLQQNIEITNLSNFKTKAFTKYYFEINNENDILNLKEILEFAGKNTLKVLFVGAGTNMLFAFNLFDGIVIKNNLKGYDYNENTKILEVYSSEKITQIALDLENNYNQNIWHRFIGLPGSVGGALFGNAGCFGLETENNFLKAIVYNLSTNKLETLTKDELNFSYRSSLFKQTKNYFIIKIYFDLSKIVEKYSSDVDNIKFRKELQPKGNSCGSFFKNPSKENSAGSLIEGVGLKGFIYNNAYFSDKHANFLMTLKDNGDYKDLIYLIKLAQEKVLSKFDLLLENEVQIITN